MKVTEAQMQREINKANNTSKTRIHNLRKSYETTMSGNEKVKNAQIDNIKKNNKQGQRKIVEGYEVKLDRNGEKAREAILTSRSESRLKVHKIARQYEDEKIVMKQGFKNQLSDLKSSYESMLIARDNEMSDLKEQVQQRVKLIKIDNRKRELEVDDYYKEKFAELERDHKSETKALVRQLTRES